MFSFRSVFNTLFFREWNFCFENLSCTSQVSCDVNIMTSELLETS